VSTGSLCTNGACPVRLLKFPDDEEDFRDLSFTVSYWLVFEVYEPESGIGSSTCEMHISADAGIFPHALVIPCVKDWTTEREEMRFRAHIERAASLLPLNRSTGAMLCIPACTSETCKISNETDHLKQSCYLSRGYPFYCLGREEGYPPRVA
jgi:hypothetical protein